MKQLKFNHQIARSIIGGEKTSTFRMFDDKDLTVNDRVEVIDKVDPEKPATWKAVGTIKINSIIEKRLKDITNEELREYDLFLNFNELLESVKRFYGKEVSADSPVKVINFSVISSDQGVKTSDSAEETEEIKLYSDGGSRGNPGPSAGGYVLMDMSDNLLVKKGVYFGVTTNNQAEYLALKMGLEEAEKMGVKTIHIHLDSLLVVNQMNGVYKIKNRDLWPIHDSIKQIIKRFDEVTFTHVPRVLNKIADQTVNDILDQAETEQA